MHNLCRLLTLAHQQLCTEVAVLFHPLHGKINDQSLSEEAHLSTIDLPNGDVVSSVESGPNLAKVVWIGVVSRR